MTLLRDAWVDLDSHELRLLLDDRIGGPGQYDGSTENQNTLHLPGAGSSCRVVIRFDGSKIASIQPGPDFDGAEWARVTDDIDNLILVGRSKVGRLFSFTSRRVTGSWRGDRSKVQILPPPSDAPRATEDGAEHPFVLEFPLQPSTFVPVTLHRLNKIHRDLTLLLNLLLIGRTNIQPRRGQHIWANVAPSGFDVRWVHQYFDAPLGEAVVDALSPPCEQGIEEVDPSDYEAGKVREGRLRIAPDQFCVPTDLDESICSYLGLSRANRAIFDLALYWFDMASRQWVISASTSFASLVSAVEAMTGRGKQIPCFTCNRTQEIPGATKRFRDFFEKYAPGSAHKNRRNAMYDLRSGILHGSKLMQLDRDLAFGWDPPWWNEQELHAELWGITTLALRNWLKNPPPAPVVELIPEG